MTLIDDDSLLTQTQASPSSCVPLAEFRWDAESLVWVHPNYQPFRYTEGEQFEAQVRRWIAEANDRSIFSPELRAHICDWPTESHFSPVRQNLLRHIPFAPSDRILELGAGCGPITRQLGETGASVTAVEGSLARARCAAVRCQDLPNVRVHCSDFQNVALAPEYDYVTLIGVLEYSPMFLGGADPMIEALQIARSALKPDGKLIIAIENQMGLKYFLGFSEDHVGQPYFGIEGLHTSSTPKTLGQQELRALLQRAGFASAEFQYPFPDYKCPTAVITDQALQTEGFAPGEIVSQIRSREYHDRGPRPVREAFVWPSLAANGLLGAMANSFLVIAGLSESTPPLQPGLLAMLYATNRCPAFNTRTQFVSAPDGQIVVTKTRLQPDALAPSGPLRLELETSAYVPDSHVGIAMVKRLAQGDRDGFLADCRAWIELVRREGMQAEEPDVWRSPLKPEYFDCIPINLLRTPTGDLAYIDREWRGESTLDLLIVRGLYLLCVNNQGYATYSEPTFDQFLGGLLSDLHLTFDTDLRDRFIVMQARLSVQINQMESVESVEKSVREILSRRILGQPEEVRRPITPARVARLLARKARGAARRAQGLMQRAE